MTLQGVDYVGLIFGKLTVLKKSGVTGMYLCQCECGKQSVVKRQNLKDGRTRSCGCGKGRKGTSRDSN